MEVNEMMIAKAKCERAISDLLRDLQAEVRLNVLAVNGKRCASDWEWMADGRQLHYSSLDFPERIVKIELGIPRQV